MSEILPTKIDKSIQADSRQIAFESITLEEIKSSSDGKKAKKVLKEVGWFALKTAGISAAVLGGIAVAVPLIGFSAGGVVAGSAAAAYQSAFLGGTIASGSAFATLQSIGAAGLAASTQAGIIAGSATASGAHSISKIFKKDKQTDNKNDKDEKHANENDISQTDIIAGGSKRNVSTQTEFEVKNLNSSPLSDKTVKTRL